MVGCTGWTTVLFYILALSVFYSDAEGGRKKDRDVSGLYPFPRVGRANFYNSVVPGKWPIAYLNNPAELAKRQGLIPFPRVGRSGSKIEQNQDDGWSTTNNRLARLGKPIDWSVIEFDGETAMNKDLAAKYADGKSLLGLINSEDDPPGRSQGW